MGHAASLSQIKWWWWWWERSHNDAG